MNSSNPLLTVENLGIDFQTGRGTLHAVKRATFEVKEGEAYGLVGESGSGKSVTALALLRLLPPNGKITSGSIRFQGKDLSTLSDPDIRSIRGREISMVFQDPQASFDPVFTIADQIGEAITIHQRIPAGEVDDRIIQLLRSVGIPEPEIRKDQYPHQFSGGMKQRAMSAMALANRPKLIIADEPTTSLDVTIQAQIMELFSQLKKDFQVSILLITHDMGLIADLCDRVSVMYAGYILETADVFSLFESPHHPYTRALIESIPRLDQEKKELESIPGRVPNPLEVFTPCIFEPRCKFAAEVCKSGMPELLPVGPRARVACFRVQKGEI